MFRGHGRGTRLGRAASATPLLGVIWVLFTWSVLGNVAAARAVLAAASPTRSGRAPSRSPSSRPWSLLIWGYAEAMRVPRVKPGRRDDARLGAGLDGAARGADHRHPLRPDRPGALVGRGRRAWSTSSTPTSSATPATSPTAPSRSAADQAAPLGDDPGAAGPDLRDRQPRVLRRGAGLARPHGRARLGGAAQPAHRGRARRRPKLVVAGIDDRTATGSGPPGPRRRPRGRAGRHRSGRCRYCCWPTSPSRSPTPSSTASTCRSPGTPTAGRSGRSTTSCASTSRSCRACPGTASAPSSTPAAVPASGARRSGSSRRARSPC